MFSAFIKSACTLMSAQSHLSWSLQRLVDPIRGGSAPDLCGYITMRHDRGVYNLIICSSVQAFTSNCVFISYSSTQARATAGQRLRNRNGSPPAAALGHLASYLMSFLTYEGRVVYMICSEGNVIIAPILLS